MKTRRQILGLAILAALCGLTLSNCANGPIARANAKHSSTEEIARESRRALNDLYGKNPKARQLGMRAQGIIVFPSVVKGGLMFGGMGGNGAYFRSDGSVGAYYQTTGLSYGLQVGFQRFGYAVFLMDREAVEGFRHSDGWEVGSSPSIVIVDQGIASSLTTSTIDKGTYAFFFDQQGLMGGLSLEGSKITRIYPAR